MEISIRKATEADLSSIYQLIRDFAEFHGSLDHFHLKENQMLQDKNLFKCLVAEIDSQFVGYAFYFFTYYSWSGKGLYLDDLFVKEEFRQKGVGKKLLLAVIEEAREENCKKVRWQVSRWNSNAIEFYKNIGAKIDEVEINCNYELGERSVPH